MSSIKKIKALEAEIASKQSELERLKVNAQYELKNQAVRPLSEIPDKEKIRRFEELYGSAEYMLKEKEAKGYIDDDNENFAWESIMKLLARDNDKFWKYYNSLK